MVVTTSIDMGNRRKSLKFRKGDFIWHKDYEKRTEMFLQGVVIGICTNAYGRRFYVLNTAMALIVENQDEWEIGVMECDCSIVSPNRSF